MAQRYHLGPDRHNTTTRIIIDQTEIQVWISNPKRLPFDLLMRPTRDGLLGLMDEAIADDKTDENVRDGCRAVRNHLLRPTANG